MSKTNFTVNRDKLQIVVERTIEASQQAIWKAYTTPELIAQWWGPRKYKTVVDTMEVRIGGKWRFIQSDEKGEEFGFHGEYKEITAPEKLVYTFEYEGMPGHVLTDTISLEKLEGNKTKLSETSSFSVIEDLDGMINTGMEGGATESIERLVELVES